MIVGERRLHPTWGPKKIRRILETKHGIEKPPAVSTVGAVFTRHGMVKARRQRAGAFKVEGANSQRQSVATTSSG
ncbi:MAG: hypothetical protein ACI9NC_005364 [Verrucomicrobiales bacterium]